MRSDRDAPGIDWPGIDWVAGNDPDATTVPAAGGTATAPGDPKRADHNDVTATSRPVMTATGVRLRAAFTEPGTPPPLVRFAMLTGSI